MAAKKELTREQRAELLQTLKTRFEKNKARHPEVQWPAVQAKLENEPAKLWSLNEMERTGGEPDVVAYDAEKDVYTFVDCSPESPAGRRSLCYDREALDARKENKPVDNAMEMAAEMGIEMLDEQEYRELQRVGKFDLKTSSWLKTPPEIRKHGGAIFGDRRYEHVFMYHNGAISYYAARGFRGSLKV